MINHGLINPNLLSLLARVRHTNALVIADRGFPFWPMIETVDVSVVDDLPSVCQLIAAVRANHQFTQAFQAKEFLKNNPPAIRQKFAAALDGVPTSFEPHIAFKKRVPMAIGLIRTGDTVPYANTILISG
jgi:D-ribose pyranase